MHSILTLVKADLREIWTLYWWEGRDVRVRGTWDHRGGGMDKHLTASLHVPALSEPGGGGGW